MEINHIMSISKFLTDLCAIRQKIRIKITFGSIVYYVLVLKKKETCLKMNSKQSVKLESGLIKLKNYFKQLDVPFKVYVDFESILKWIKQNNRKSDTSHIRKFQNHIQSYLY